MAAPQSRAGRPDSTYPCAQAAGLQRTDRTARGRSGRGCYAAGWGGGGWAGGWGGGAWWHGPLGGRRGLLVFPAQYLGGSECGVGASAGSGVGGLRVGGGTGPGLPARRPTAGGVAGQGLRAGRVGGRQVGRAGWAAGPASCRVCGWLSSVGVGVQVHFWLKCGAAGSFGKSRGGESCACRRFCSSCPLSQLECSVGGLVGRGTSG